MKAWQIQQLGEPAEAIALADVPVPEPADAEVRIAVDATAISLPDVFMCRGTYAFRPELPFIPGQEVSGVVVAAGKDAKTPVGERVMAVTSFFRAPSQKTRYTPDRNQAERSTCRSTPSSTPKTITDRAGH